MELDLGYLKWKGIQGLGFLRRGRSAGGRALSSLWGVAEHYNIMGFVCSPWGFFEGNIVVLPSDGSKLKNGIQKNSAYGDFQPRQLHFCQWCSFLRCFLESVSHRCTGKQRLGNAFSWNLGAGTTLGDSTKYIAIWIPVHVFFLFPWIYLSDLSEQASKYGSFAFAF